MRSRRSRCFFRFTYPETVTTQQNNVDVSQGTLVDEVVRVPEEEQKQVPILTVVEAHTSTQVQLEDDRKMENISSTTEQIGNSRSTTENIESPLSTTRNMKNNGARQDKSKINGARQEKWKTHGARGAGG